MTKFLRFGLLAAAASAMIFASCGGGGGSSDDSEDEGGASYPGVYLAGTDLFYNPVIWNGRAAEKLSLPSGEYGAAEGVALGSGHVYVVGYHALKVAYTPCVWVDGVRADLQAGGVAAKGFAYAVAVYGTTVYAAGCVWDDFAAAYTPGYWVYSGSSWDWHQLASRDGVAVAVAIDGSGYAVFAEGSSDSATLPIYYWTFNGTAYAQNSCALPPGTTASGVKGIGVSGASVIVVGFQEHGGVKYPCYWTDGARTDLTAPVGSPDAVEGAMVSGGDVYIAGECYSSDYIPGYWKNGTWTALPYAGRLNHLEAIALSGADVYVAGHYDPESYTVGCFWKNGERVDVSGVSPRAIAVK